uniref:F-box domain-containing protein n=1 Tax=Oryza meridionalis TaxID=40149 RepID=A0A0E0ECU5_9ORYZ
MVLVLGAIAAPAPVRPCPYVHARDRSRDVDPLHARAAVHGAMVVIVPINGDGDGEGGSGTFVADNPPDPAPAPMDIDDDGDGRDRGGEGDSPATQDLLSKLNGSGGEGDSPATQDLISKLNGSGGEDDSAAAARVPGGGGEGEGDSAPLSLALGLHLHVHGDGGGGDGVDRISNLPNDILAFILGQLGDTRKAAVTSVLSRRWINLWTQVDILILRYDKPPDSRFVQEALAAHAHATEGSETTDIRLLEVISLNRATPEATAALLRVAAPRLTGELYFRNRSSAPFEALDLELPCLTEVTKITLSLGFLGLSLPQSGSFGKLRELHLEHVRFNGDYTLDDAMLPPLGIFRHSQVQWLGLPDAQAGISDLDGTVRCGGDSSARRRGAWTQVDSVSIVAEELEEIEWIRDEKSVTDSMRNNIQLPYIRILNLALETEGHVYGASVLHILTKRTTIAELTLVNQEKFKSDDACKLECICDGPPNWRETDISMRYLRKVEILNFRGEEHELDLLRVLVRVAPALRMIRIICHRSFAAWETLSAHIRGFAREATSVEGEGGRDKAVAVADPVPAPMDVDGDRGALDVLAPAPMDLVRDRDGGGDRAALVASTSNGGGRGGLLNDLPEDILAGILGRLRDTRAAAKTSLLSRRWRHVWKWVPHDSSPVRAALAAHAVHAVTSINKLYVVCLLGATPDATASWLRVAAPLISGELLFCNRGSLPFHVLFDEVFSDTIEERGALELPCFTRATKIRLRLGFLCLSLPPSGVFAALRELHLVFVRFNGELTLDDTVMPFLEGVEIWCSRGLASLTLRLKHLTSMNLARVCIVAEELLVLKWLDWYLPESVNFNSHKIRRLRMISVSPFYPYGRHRQHNIFNPSCDRLLKLFSRIRCLEMLHLVCVKPLMEGITGLTDISFLHLHLVTHGHAYGASVLHILAMCLVQHACSPNCSCDWPPKWRDNKDISMRSLGEVEILNFRGKEHELDLLRVLVRVATGLRRIRITCHRSFAAWERLSADIQSFARPEISVEHLTFWNAIFVSTEQCVLVAWSELRTEVKCEHWCKEQS